jgi:Fe(3+) dicitrate transport protein
MRFLLSILVFGLTAQNVCGQNEFRLIFKDAEDIELALPKITAEFNKSKGEEKLKSDTDGIILISNPDPEGFTVFIQAEGYWDELALISSQEIQIGYREIFLRPRTVTLSEVEIRSDAKESGLSGLFLSDVVGFQLYSGKKTELIIPEELPVNLSMNRAREIFISVPGLNIWESSSAGLGTEIGGRGLSPVRSSNFNIRQNTYDISADALGYPDAYYTPPVEIVDQIHVVRGAASLQYGTQFGGMINYLIAPPPTNKTWRLKLGQTAGSFKQVVSDVQCEAGSKKFGYKGALQYRGGETWRPNSAYDSWFTYQSFRYKMSENAELWGEYTHFQYLAQQPGGLTDAQFQSDPGQSIRERNWFSVNWHLPSLRFLYKPNFRWRWESLGFGLIAGRNAVGILNNITRADPLTERDLLKDTYKNIGWENRVLHTYFIGEMPQQWLIGSRIFRGRTTKKQGLGSDGFDADFDFLNPERLEGSDYLFPSFNFAIFSEHIFRPHVNWSISPGIRYEYIQTQAEGYYRVLTTDLVGNPLLDTTINEEKSNPRHLFIAGLGIEWKGIQGGEVYANFSQNYRGVNFNDIRIANPNFRVDPNLQDERGWTADIGIRGMTGDFLTYDVSAFALLYGNRIGFVLEYDTVLFNTYRYRTNIGKSLTMGIEMVGQIDLTEVFKHQGDWQVNFLANFSIQRGRYTQSDEPAIEGNQIELVPVMNLRNQVYVGWKNLGFSLQSHYVGKQFSDATNAEFSPDAIGGKIPAYFILDAFLQYNWKGLSAILSVNNLTNNRYFTRRAVGYPGPGIIPADAISVSFGLSYSLGGSFN